MAHRASVSNNAACGIAPYLMGDTFMKTKSFMPMLPGAMLSLPVWAADVLNVKLMTLNLARDIDVLGKALIRLGTLLHHGL